MKEELKKLAELNEEIASLEKQIGRIKENVAIKYAPVKVGEIIYTNGYTHKGKKIVVEQVVFRSRFGRYEFCARGPVLKKDGSPGLIWGDWRKLVE